MSNLISFIKKNSAIFIFLFFWVFLAYINSLNSDFVSDDILAIPKNPKIGDINSFLSQPYAFFQPLLYYLAFKIGGLNPVFYRMINVLFHLGTVWIVYGLLYLMSTSRIAFFTSAIFAVHPILIESITWISGGSYARYSFFLLASLLTYKLSEKNKIWYYASVILYALSLFSSEKAIVFPLLLFAYEIAFSNIRKNWKRFIPFFILSFFWVWMYFLKTGQRTAGLQSEFYQEPTIYNPLIQIPIAVTSYLQLMFWPDKLTLYHSEMSFTQIEYFVRLGAFLVFTAFSVYGFIRNRFIFFWLSFFIISLSVTLLPFGWSWIVAERYIYLGSIGVVTVFAYFLSRMVENKRVGMIGYSLFMIILIGLTVRTIIRNFDWKNEDTLWMATGKSAPSYHVTHNNLGDLYARRGDFERAIIEFKQAIMLKPNYADAYHNLGNSYRMIGQDDEAIKSYKEAIKYNKNLWQSYNNLASIYFRRGNYLSAKNYLIKAIDIMSSNADLYANLGVIYLRLDKKNEAKQYFLKTLDLDPNNQLADRGLKELDK